MNERTGIDAALGFGSSGGSQGATNAGTTVTTDKQGTLALLLHFGVPIGISQGKHVAMLIIPEANFGYASSTVKSQGAGAVLPDTSLSGMRLDLGARAGMEVYFGFIGIPQLALEGSVGAYLTYQSVKASIPGSSLTDSTTLITTSAFASPWDIFRSNVAARYYF
jgi:hypothetical protein